MNMKDAIVELIKTRQLVAQVTNPSGDQKETEFFIQLVKHAENHTAEEGKPISYFDFLKDITSKGTLDACGGEDFIRPYFNQAKVWY